MNQQRKLEICMAVSRYSRLDEISGQLKEKFTQRLVG